MNIMFANDCFWNIRALPQNIRCSHRNLDNAWIRGTHEPQNMDYGNLGKEFLLLVIQVNRVNLQSDIEN